MPQVHFILPEVIQLGGRDSAQIHYLNVVERFHSSPSGVQRSPAMNPGARQTSNRRPHVRVPSIHGVRFYHEWCQEVKPQCSTMAIVYDAEIDMPPAGGYNGAALLFTSCPCIVPH
jgi:hypothetical protein